jgi:hypothetical protein
MSHTGRSNSAVDPMVSFDLLPAGRALSLRCSQHQLNLGMLRTNP